MKIALASPRPPVSVTDGLLQAAQLVEEAAQQQAEIICFPESYIPGYPGMGLPEDRSPERMQQALEQVKQIAAQNAIAIIMPMDRYEGASILNVAFVISADGAVLGYQAKNQLDPTEDTFWTPGTERSIFEVNGVTFGITICHEGFRYPESVRWAARHGAQIVFHPHCTGSDTTGVLLTEWGHKNNPYYEKAMMMRALENTIYFASSNYAFKYPDSASSIIAPDGACMAHGEYGKSGVTVTEIDPALATGLLAKRYRSALYVKSHSSVNG